MRGIDTQGRREKDAGAPRPGMDMIAKPVDYFVVKKKALPDVLQKVAEAKRLWESGQVSTVQDAVESVGISRSSFYKYKDDIFPFHEDAWGRTITFTMQVEDVPGALSNVLGVIASFGANILTLHQSIPISGMAALSVSIQVLPTTRDTSSMMEELTGTEGVRELKIVARG